MKSHGGWECFLKAKKKVQNNYLILIRHFVVIRQKLMRDIASHKIDPFEKEDANGDFENPFYDFLGVDNGANISFAVTYGIGNLFDVSVARYSISKLYILGSRVNIFNEKVDKTPMSLSIEPNVGYRTERYTDEIAKDRKLTTGIQLIVAKDFF